MQNLTTTTYITANKRLVRYLCQEHEQSNCLSLDSWLNNNYQALQDNRLLLTSHQELTVWENIISHSLSHINLDWALLSTREITEKAKDAWYLLKNWQVPLPALATTDLQEVRTFYRWALTFEKTCHEKKWLDFATCTDVVIKAVIDKKLVLPGKLIVVGFMDTSPQIQQLFKVLADNCDFQYQPITQTKQNREVGWAKRSVRAHQTMVGTAKNALAHPTNKDMDSAIKSQDDTNAQRTSLANEETELLAMAHWAYQQHTENPQHTIGCIVPNLAANRHVIERIFNDVFKSTTKFNVAGGFTFNYFPLIQAALAILKLSTTTLDTHLLSRLLTSPFLGGAEQETATRALLDIALRETLELQLSWQQVFAITSQQDNCPGWLAQLKQYWQHLQVEQHYQSASAWSQYFVKQLKTMGWPGERSLDSAEYQQLQRWQSLLAEFSALDLVLEKSLSLSQALHYLTQLVNNTVFQPETSTAPVQILGLLDAVGLSFDCLWVANMTNEDWPASLSPNPLLPLHLQRACHMPKASPERELTYSRALTQHFCQSSPAVIFSYALHKEDRLQLPSALILDIPESDTHFVVPTKTGIQESLLEYIEDDYGPALQAEEVLRGNSTSIFKYQAACPFKAFAQIRLAAKSMPTPTFHITLQERGIYLHAILERVWQTLRNHQTLCEHTEATLDSLLQSIVSEVLNVTAKKRAAALKPNFIALEKKRLIAQVKAWLDLEKKRLPFKVIALEEKNHTQFAGLSLKLRVDRVDELADGTRIVIDYKTGKCHPADWFGERPDDPQLPLYALTQQLTIKGLAFAQLSANQLQFIGISEKADIIPGILSIDEQKYDKVATWHEFYKQLELNLSRLAEEFLAGYAKVNPKQKNKTCRYCDLKSLCRINGF